MLTMLAVDVGLTGRARSRISLRRTPWHRSEEPGGGLLGTGARSTERRSWQRVGNLTAWSRRCLECTRPCLVHRYQYASSLYSIVLFNVIVLQILSRILYT